MKRVRIETVILALVLTVAATGLFSYGSGLPEPVAGPLSALTREGTGAPASPEGEVGERYRDQLSPQGREVYDRLEGALAQPGTDGGTVEFSQPMTLTLASPAAMGETLDWPALMAGLTPESAAQYAGATLLPLEALLLDRPGMAWVQVAQAQGQSGFSAGPVGYQKDETALVLTGIAFQPQLQAAASGEELAQAVEAFPLKGENRYDQVKAIHDGLIKQVRYDRDGEARAQDALLSPEEAAAAGGGYARAFKLLCDRAGIPCLVVEGTGEDGRPHGWNLVGMEDGQWYGVDAARDDIVPMSRQYFLAGSESFDPGHRPGEGFLFALPDLASADYEGEDQIGLAQEHPPVAQGQWVYGDTLEDSAVTISGGEFRSPSGDLLEGTVHWLEEGRAQSGQGVQAARYRFLPDNKEYGPYIGEVEVELAPRPLTIVSVAIREKEYDGGTEAALVSIGFDGVLEGDRAQVAEGLTTARAAFDDPEVGEDKAFTVEPGRLTGWEDRYTLSGEAVTFSGGVIRRARLPAKAQPQLVKFGKAEQVTLDLDQAIAFEAEAVFRGDPGRRRYALGQVENPHGILAGGSVRLEGGVLRFSTTAQGEEGQRAVIPITVESDRCEATVAELVVERAGKESVAFTVPVTSKTYDGEPVLVGEPSQTGNWNYTYSYQGARRNGEPYGPAPKPPADAGSYTLTATLDGPDHKGEYKADFFILPRTVTVRGEAEPVLVGNTPRITYTYSGLIQGDSPHTPRLLTGKPQAVCAAGTDRPGRFPLEMKTLPTALNYDFAPAKNQGLLTVSPRQPDERYYTVSPQGAEGWYRGEIKILPTGKDGFDSLVVQGEDQPYTRARPLVLTGEDGRGEVTFRLGKSGGEARTEVAVFSYGRDNAPPLIANLELTQGKGEAAGKLTVTVQDRLSGMGTVTLTGPDGVAVSRPAEKGTASFVVAESGDYIVRAEDLLGNQATEWKRIALAAPGLQAIDSAALSGAANLDQFWTAVSRQLAQAGEGDVLAVELEEGATVPEGVIGQMRSSKATVVFRWPDGRQAALRGEDITGMVPGGYGCARLVQMAGDRDPDEVLAGGDAVVIAVTGETAPALLPWNGRWGK